MIRAVFVTSFLTLVSVGPVLAAGSYRITTVDVPGSTASEATGINDRGQIVGYFFDASLKQHGFLLSTGQVTTIDVPLATSTRATGINNKGEMVGFYENPVGQLHGFLLSGGQFTMIDPPTGISFGRIGIDDTGRMWGLTRMPATPSTGSFAPMANSHRSTDALRTGSIKPARSRGAT